MKLHHVALCVSDIRQAVDWYVQNLNANIAYQDETWALLDIENTSIALVLPSQHPPRWCQANANQSPICQQTTGSCRQLTPLGQRGGAVLLEDGAAVEMAVEIKMVEG